MFLNFGNQSKRSIINLQEEAYSMSIRLEKVFARYSGTTILHNVDLNLNGRDIILGPNGSGKTTLFRTILGVNVHSEGRIEIDGVDVKKIKGTAGILATNLDEVYDLLRIPIRDVAKLYLELGKGDFSRFLSMVEEFEAFNALNKRLDELSAGQRRIVCNLIALAMNTKYVLLDEPFENMDPARRVKMARIIMDWDCGIVMNTHATWLLDKFSDWQAHLMFHGKAYGPMKVNDLLDARIVEGQRENALNFKIRERSFSLVSGKQGIRLTEMESLDRLFEVGL
jgi:ABC-type Mn2+/Zn2+ transport system ATPase subunit